MNIKIPKAMKSPTVVIIGKDSDGMESKRLDYLEKKIDQQYKMVVEMLKSDSKAKNKTLTDVLKASSSSNNEMMKSLASKFDSLRDTFGTYLKDAKSEKVNNNNLDELEAMLDHQYKMFTESLKESRKIKPTVIVKNIQRVDKIEEAIKNSRPKRSISPERKLATEIGKMAFQPQEGRKLYPMIPYAS